MPKTNDFNGKRIIVQFIPQVYRNKLDDHPMELDAVEVDVTERVLDLSLYDLNLVLNDELDPSEVDDLIPNRVLDAHDGPFRIEGLQDSARDFFEVQGIPGVEISMETHEAAREAINTPRIFSVMVERTETRHVWIEVNANSEFEAESKALEAAGDIDFYSEGSASDPIYQVSELADATQEVSAKPVRPKF